MCKWILKKPVSVLLFMPEVVYLLLSYQSSAQSLPGTPMTQSKRSIALDTFPDTREGVFMVFKILQQIKHISPDSAIFFGRLAIQKSQSMREDSLLMTAYYAMCIVFQTLTEFDSAMFYTRKAGNIAFRYGYRHGRGEFYNFMARYHRHLGHLDSAIHYFQVYDQFLAQGGKMNRRWLPQQEMALFYMDLEDFEKANGHMEDALKYARMEKVPMDYLYVLYTALDLYGRQENRSKVSSLSEEYLGFKLERGTNILDTSQHILLFLPGMENKNRLEEIRRYLDVQLAQGDWLSALSSYHSLGSIYISKKEDAKAIEPLKAALDLSYTLSYAQLRYNMHSALFSVYDRIQDHTRALQHHKAMVALLDTIRNQEREKLMHDLEVKYETAEKEHQLAEANYRLEGAKRRQQLYTMGGLALLIIIGAIGYAYKQKRKSVVQLAEKNAVITKSLTEKDILLREIHHRVKNNLQMISALLYLHGKSVEDSSAQEALLESQNRVQSMAMIHQNLYQDSNLLGVSVKNYLDKLLNHLIASYNVERDRIDIRTRIEIEHLDVDTIVPLALIVNELISNSLKYAFRDGRRGLIEVFIGRVDDQIVLEVKDNGVGLPEGFKVDTSPNFGYKLINILSERLGATLSALSSNGTLVSVSIPVKKAA
ncbi:MAG TPA: sensor histidine kinase [Saprospiraceae bacterium]|nr:sensor histidine kinase [Saprospiraceae bacterium]